MLKSSLILTAGLALGALAMPSQADVVLGSGGDADDLYANHGHTPDSLIEQLDREGMVYSDTRRKFSRSVLHRI